MHSKSTKKSLVASGLSLLVCAALLIGTTFAWFTDSVTNTGNRIQAGEFKIDLLMDKEQNGTYESIANGEGDIFSEKAGNGVNWEPGVTHVVYLAVQNKGSLALNYNLLLDVTDGDPGLVGSLEYAVLDGKKAADLESVKSWADILEVAGVQTGEIAAGQTVAAPNGTLDEIVRDVENETDYFALAVHMKEDAGNAYQGGSITIDLTLTAKQATAEKDGFGSDQYDKNAEYVTPVSTPEELAAAVAEGGNILLQNDMAVPNSMTVEEGTEVVIDLNGKTITATSGFSSRLFTNRGTLTLRGDGTVDVTGAGANGYGTVNNFGTLTVEGGTYINGISANASNFYNRNGGTATFIDATIYGGGGCIATEIDTTTDIHGGYYENNTYPAIENRGNMLITAGNFVNSSCSSCDNRWGYAVRSGESSDSAYLKIQGETEDSVKVTGVQGGLAVVGGTADIYNGVYETVGCKTHGDASAFYAGYFTGESFKTATTIYGGTFRSASKVAVLVGNGNPAPDSGQGQESTLIVNGGTFIGGDAAKTAIQVNKEEHAIGAAKIYGGKFSSNPEEFLAEGCKVSQNGDLWDVVAQ